jgi:Sulfotransferase family
MTLTTDQRPYIELIVLCGPPRSGTTWLNRELCNVPTAFPFLPECTLITQQIELYSRTLHYCDHQRFHAYFANQQNLLYYFRANVTRLIDQAANLNQKPDAKTLVIKDPLLCLYLEDIKDVLPPHKLVVLVRDPRDVLASMKKVAARKKQKWNVGEAANELSNYYYQIGNHQKRADKDSIFLRYEDLVAGQTTILQDFLQQTNENVAFTQADASVVRDRLDLSDPFFSELYLQPTTSDKVGSYNKILSGNEIYYIESFYSDVMQRWDYLNFSSMTRAKWFTKRWLCKLWS